MKKINEDEDDNNDEDEDDNEDDNEDEDRFFPPTLPRFTVTLLHYDFQFCYIKSEMKLYIIYNIKVFFIMGGG